jgi:hypothetical protein
MSLKKLAQFSYFDTEGFLSKLSLIAISSSEWKNFESGEHKGTKVDLVIASDKHKYKAADGENVSNLYEKLTVKVPKDIDVPMNSHVKLINPVATIYGQYRNQLSIVADDIEVLK